MGQSTTYRVRWPAALKDLELLQAMLPAAALPLSEPRRYDDALDDVSLVAPGVSIASLVPSNDIQGPAYWSYDGTDFAFTADLNNPQYRHDTSMFSEIGEPSRERTLFDAFTQTCGAPDGTIVGAWMNTHTDIWHPMLFAGGRVIRGFINYSGPKRDGVVQHNGRLPAEMLAAENGSVSIPAEAFT